MYFYTLSKASPGASSMEVPSKKYVVTFCTIAIKQCPPDIKSTRYGKSICEYNIQVYKKFIEILSLLIIFYLSDRTG